MTRSAHRIYHIDLLFKFNPQSVKERLGEPSLFLQSERALDVAQCRVSYDQCFLLRVSHEDCFGSDGHGHSSLTRS